eukprot:gb/GECH01003915.1/.p1 GENE.gb/GECH01003915.1/~~gb/GECH01003915.1/.p1  ORF type:complete len:963 (+),score=252.86 gb/GECH01003915.1/:1-2889(+)
MQSFPLETYHDSSKNLIYMYLSTVIDPSNSLKEYQNYKRNNGSNDDYIMSFSEFMEEKSYMLLRAQLFMFQTCHIITFIESKPIFDMNHIRTFRALQLLKQSHNERFLSYLDSSQHTSNMKLSSLYSPGRVLPVISFVFQHPNVESLGQNVPSVLEKLNQMEQSLESQTRLLLRKSKFAGTDATRTPLFMLDPMKCVFIMGKNTIDETGQDPLVSFLQSSLTQIAHNNSSPPPTSSPSLSPSSSSSSLSSSSEPILGMHSMREFLHRQYEYFKRQMQSGKRYTLPTSYNWFHACWAFEDLMLGRDRRHQLNDFYFNAKTLLNPDWQFSEGRCTKALSVSSEQFSRSLSDQMYTSKDQLLQEALSFYDKLACGPFALKYREKLQSECIQLWEEYHQSKRESLEDETSSTSSIITTSTTHRGFGATSFRFYIRTAGYDTPPTPAPAPPPPSSSSSSALSSSPPSSSSPNPANASLPPAASIIPPSTSSPPLASPSASISSAPTSSRDGHHHYHHSYHHQPKLQTIHPSKYPRLFVDINDIPDTTSPQHALAQEPDFIPGTSELYPVEIKIPQLYRTRLDSSWLYNTYSSSSLVSLSSKRYQNNEEVILDSYQYGDSENSDDDESSHVLNRKENENENKDVESQDEESLDRYDDDKNQKDHFFLGDEIQYMRHILSVPNSSSSPTNSSSSRGTKTSKGSSVPQHHKRRGRKNDSAATGSPKKGSINGSDTNDNRAMESETITMWMGYEYVTTTGQKFLLSPQLLYDSLSRSVSKRGNLSLSNTDIPLFVEWNDSTQSEGHESGAMNKGRSRRKKIPTKITEYSACLRRVHIAVPDIPLPLALRPRLKFGENFDGGGNFHIIFDLGGTEMMLPRGSLVTLDVSYMAMFDGLVDEEELRNSYVCKLLKNMVVAIPPDASFRCSGRSDQEDRSDASGGFPLSRNGMGGIGTSYYKRSQPVEGYRSKAV